MNDSFAVRLRIGLVLVVLLVAIFTVLDALAFPRSRRIVFLTTVEQLAALFVLFAVSLRTQRMRVLQFGVFALFIAILIGMLPVARATRQLTELANSLILAEMGTAILLPWGPGCQTMILALASSGFFAGMLVADKVSASEVAQLAWVVSCGLVSVAVTAVLERSRVELAQARMREHELIAGLAHDIRSPVALIAMRAEIAQSQEPGGAEERESLRMIEGYAREVLMATENLTDVLQFDRKAVTPAPQFIDANPILEEALEEVSKIAELAGVELVLKKEVAPALVAVQPHQLRAIAVKSLHSALKSQPSERRVTVAVQSRSDASSIEITIGKLGPNLDPYVALKTLSDPQLAGETSQRAHVGLAVAERLVELLGGEFGIERSGSGASRFRVVFPVTKPEQPPKVGYFARMLGWTEAYKPRSVNNRSGTNLTTNISGRHTHGT